MKNMAKWHRPLSAAEDFRIGVEGGQQRSQAAQFRLAHQILLVDDDDIGKFNLFD